MGCALKIQTILGKVFLKIERMVERTILVFILGFGLLRRSRSLLGFGFLRRSTTYVLIGVPALLYLLLPVVVLASVFPFLEVIYLI